MNEDIIKIESVEAGDINGDSINDITIGCPFSGQVHVVLGKSQDFKYPVFEQRLFLSKIQVLKKD